MLLATTTVTDFDQFMKVFTTAGADKLRANGSKGAQVFRDPTLADRAWVVFNWDGAGWQSFVSDPKAPVVRKGAGHTSKPMTVVLAVPATHNTQTNPDIGGVHSVIGARRCVACAGHRARRASSWSHNITHALHTHSLGRIPRVTRRIDGHHRLAFSSCAVYFEGLSIRVRHSIHFQSYPHKLHN